jgi:hypothetical protein
VGYKGALLSTELRAFPERGLVGVFVFPVAEIGNEVFADLSGRIFAGIGIEAFPLASFRKQY